MTITLTREEAQEVLFWLKGITLPATDDLAETLRTRLAQPEPEPVAWHEPGAYGNVTVYKDWAKENNWLPLYTAPPQREWQGLTTAETKALWNATKKPSEFAEMLQAKLREKNG
jgi:hypothetical protein